MAGFSLTRFMGVSAALGLTTIGGFFGYRFVRSDIEADVYRERVRALAMEYEALRSSYNEAVRRTAVTELIVKDRRLTVRVRSAAGVLREIGTPFDPYDEVYVDYVVVDGRLWIRRVFDASTPAASGLVIDPVADGVDWDDPKALRGNAVYRRLDEGRWIVTVTGDGSLGLMRAVSNEPVELATAPPVREYEEILKEADARIDQIGAGEVWRRMVGGR